jgi:WhiB family redox-sensing transcriptional regulator
MTTTHPTDPRSATGPTAVLRRGRRYPCQMADPDLWFAEMPADVEKAKSLCRECPVRLSCLAAALRRAEPWGVWGGELLNHGQIRARKRGRGRPRKRPAAA